MKEKKHIDKLFKEHFENFEVAPSPEVWNHIQTQLKKGDKDRKIIPLWIKLGGVAALIALFLTIGNSVFNSSNKNNINITEEKTSPENNNKDTNNTLKENSVDAVEIATENEITPKGELEINTNVNEVKNNANKDVIIKKSESLNTDVAFENERKKSSEKTKGTKNKPLKDDAIVNTTKLNEAVTVIQKDLDSEKNNRPDKSNESLIKKDVAISESKKTEVAVSEDKNNEENSEVIKTDEINKRSLIDVIDEQNKEKAIVTVKNKRENQWEITPNIGPVYYSSIGNGSSLDPSFSDNSKIGDVNFSYGVQIGYYLNDRLSLRSGISNVNLSYVTSDIELGIGPVSAALKSIDYGGKQIVLTAVDKGTFSGHNPNGNGFGEITPKSTTGDAEINQKLSYYEVPLELKYALVDAKIGISIIGGFSTLFLGENEVSVNAGDFESVLGSANNLTSVSFTTNIGVGLNYKLSEKLMFNIEPMFKYQLNPYTDSSVDFKPYYVGVYSGLSFKF